MSRDYYSVRTGRLAGILSIDLPTFRTLFKSVYEKLEEEGYFQEYFGYWCVDASSQDGMVKGKLGSNISSAILFSLRKSNLWPIIDCLDNYIEDDLFDMIEFLHDHCSKPLAGDYHKFNNCGMHYYKFDEETGRTRFRDEVNVLLKDYSEGYEIDTNGYILSLAEEHMNSLLQADLPLNTESSIENRILEAVNKFRRYKSTLGDRRDAIRDLADVLEYLRPEAKKVVSKSDESDLFNIANNFGIRHHNKQQKVDYDEKIWYSWLFYFYLASIHAFIRLIERGQSNSAES